MVWPGVFFFLEKSCLKWLSCSVIRREDASVTTCWERWVLMGSVSLSLYILNLAVYFDFLLDQ